MRNRSYEECLPPRDLWPDLIYRLPELQYPETLNVAAQLLDVHVAGGRGSAPAVLFRDRTITYAELQRLVNQIGNGLRAIGVGPDERVALRLPNRPELVATWLAVQKIGAVCVGTMPMLRAREIGYIVNDSGANVFVVAGDLMEEVARAATAFDHPVRIITAPAPDGNADLPAPATMTFDQLIAGQSADLNAHPTGRLDLALIAYTSGSTGVPKGASHAPADILASADAYARHVLAPADGDVFGGHPTMAFTYGLGGLLVFPFRFGAAAALLDAFTPERLLNLVGARRITVLFCAATMFRILLQIPKLEERFDLRSLRVCVSAGEPLPASVYQEWRRRTGVEILDGIGSTEMFQIFLSARAGSVRPGSTGVPVPGYDVRVVDEQLRDVPAGAPGLLAVRGPTGCRYWRKPDRQREYVRDGWNLPGDVYVRDADGYFWYQCRNDDLIISGGYNIAGPEVESVLIEHPAVLEAAVVASPDAVRTWIAKAFVVLKPDVHAGEALAAELQEHVKRELAPYKYPREVEFIDALPKTETGKIRRVELRQRERARKAPAQSS